MYPSHKAEDSIDVDAVAAAFLAILGHVVEPLKFTGAARTRPGPPLGLKLADLRPEPLEQLLVLQWGAGGQAEMLEKGKS